MWASQDGGFHAEIFYQNILDLFDNKLWVDEMLVWWNELGTTAFLNSCTNLESQASLWRSPLAAE
jgi:hypothetical protein